MSDQNCGCSGSSPSSFNYTPNSNCGDCYTSRTSNPSIDSTGIIYSGAALNCLDLSDETNVALEDILIAINQKICDLGFQSNTDYSAYNTYCVTTITGGNITTQEEFAEGISKFVCDLQDQVDTLDTDLSADITTINSTINSIRNPSLSSCAYIGVTTSDTLNQIINKIFTAVCAINTSADLSAVDWDSCFVASTPTSIKDAFSLLITQICTVKASVSSVLPTFNNTGSCLSTPGTSDSLVSTIEKIKTKLCSIPVYSVPTASFDCFTFNGVLKDDITAIATSAEASYKARIVEVVDTSGAITLEPMDVDDACAGKKIVVDLSLLDNKVGANSSDSSPSYLIDKLIGEDGITVDDTSNPGFVTIKGDSSGNDVKVKTSSSDPTSGYLIEKVMGVYDPLSGISISVAENTTVNPSSFKTQLTPSVYFPVLATALLNAIKGDSTLRALFCDIVNMCDLSSSCDPAVISLVANDVGTYADTAFRIAWVPGTSILNQTVEYKEKGSSGWLSSNTALTNPYSSVAVQAFVEGLNTNTVYQFQVISNCAAGITSTSGVKEAIVFECPTEEVTVTGSTVVITLPSMYTVDTVEFRLKRVVDSAIVATGTVSGSLASYTFTSVPNSTYVIEYRMSATVNGATVYSNSSNYLNAYCSTDPFVVGSGTTTTTSTSSTSTLP